MAYQYTDEKIPKRPVQGGRSSRSFSGASGNSDRQSTDGPGKRERSSSDTFGNRDRQSADGSGKSSSSASGNSDRSSAGASGNKGRLTSESSSHKNIYGSENQTRSSVLPEEAGMWSRWGFVTTDDILYGNQRKKYSRSSNGLDKKLGELLHMAADYQVTPKGRAEAFHQQARLMESYEPSISGQSRNSRQPYISISHIEIGYQEMDLQDLQEYFGWRARLRQKKEVPGIEGFALLYASELISLDSEKDARETFEKLLLLLAIVRKQNDDMAKRYYIYRGTEEAALARIIRDYVICRGFEPELVQEYCVENPKQETENIILSHLEEADDLSIIYVIRGLAEKKVKNSQFFEESGEDTWRVIARVFRRICREQNNSGRESLAERILGKQRTVSYAMYQRIPCEAKQVEGYHIDVSPATSYSYEKGIWKKCSYSRLRDERALRELNELLRECERVLRRKMHYRNQLSNRLKDPETERLIIQETDRWLKEKEQRNRPEIHVDLSKLAAIRSQADLTRERLLEGIEEEHENVFGAAINASEYETAGGDLAAGMNASAEDIGRGIRSDQDEDLQGEELQEKEADISSGQQGIFNAEESIFLKMLLEGGNGADYLKNLHVIPSVFVDAINEKAFDEIGDSIVEEDGKCWRLVEDYIEDVKEMLF